MWASASAFAPKQIGAGFGLSGLMKNQPLLLLLFGVCVSVPSCETTHVSCGCGEHRLRVVVDSRFLWVSAPLEQAALGLPALRSLIRSRIRTALERFTRAAMLRMQTLVCAPERYYKLRLSGQLLWGCIRCVRWHSASSAPSVALLRLQFCNSLEGPVHARRLRSHRRHGPGQVL